MRNDACSAGGDITEAADGAAYYSDTFAIFPEIALNGEAFCSLANDDGEAADPVVADFILQFGCRGSLVIAVPGY
ncbi:MAG: hypothetical protein JKY45_03310 [Emcibacter sp.]|nr:hypothetical protein [Emcibacter sp.]